MIKMDVSYSGCAVRADTLGCRPVAARVGGQTRVSPDRTRFTCAPARLVQLSFCRVTCRSWTFSRSRRPTKFKHAKAVVEMDTLRSTIVAKRAFRLGLVRNGARLGRHPRVPVEEQPSAVCMPPPGRFESRPPLHTKI